MTLAVKRLQANKISKSAWDALRCEAPSVFGAAGSKTKYALCEKHVPELTIEATDPLLHKKRQCLKRLCRLTKYRSNS